MRGRASGVLALVITVGYMKSSPRTYFEHITKLTCAIFLYTVLVAVNFYKLNSK
jgi:hypothetical protein